MSVEWGKLIHHIAHDAGALVRQGLSNAQILERKLGADVDGEVSAYLLEIIESQTNLNSLFVRLVALADAEKLRHSFAGSRDERTDLETVVLGAKLQCRDVIHRAGAELVVRQLPGCNVPQKIQVVLGELIENSLLFRDPARPLRVVIDGQADREKIRVRVGDNGMGIDAAHTDKLFEPFQRLDPLRSRFGLGLAISRAIVEAAGGSIYNEPAELGASFVFELPNRVS